MNSICRPRRLRVASLSLALPCALTVVGLLGGGCSTRSIDGWAQASAPIEPLRYPTPQPSVMLGVRGDAPAHP